MAMSNKKATNARMNLQNTIATNAQINNRIRSLVV